MENKIDGEFVQTAKADFRKKMKSEISAFVSDTQKVREAEQKTSALFLQSEFYKNASLIFAFISAGSEISTRAVIEKSLQDKKKIAVPKVIPNSRSMEFYFLENRPLELQTATGSFGITEPDDTLKKVDAACIPRHSVMLLPGLAFCKDGTRLGKGKGFYDIFLSRLFKESRNFFETGIKIGYCYSVQIKPAIPFSEKDIRVDCVVSENGFVKCGN